MSAVKRGKGIKVGGVRNEKKVNHALEQMQKRIEVQREEDYMNFMNEPVTRAEVQQMFESLVSDINETRRSSLGTSNYMSLFVKTLVDAGLITVEQINVTVIAYNEKMEKFGEIVNNESLSYEEKVAASVEIGVDSKTIEQYIVRDANGESESVVFDAMQVEGGEAEPSVKVKSEEENEESEVSQ